MTYWISTKIFNRHIDRLRSVKQLMSYGRVVAVEKQPLAEMSLFIGEGVNFKSEDDW